MMALIESRVQAAGLVTPKDDGHLNRKPSATLNGAGPVDIGACRFSCVTSPVDYSLPIQTTRVTLPTW